MITRKPSVKMDRVCWTLVQHSAFAFGGNDVFAKGVEVRHISGTMIEKVKGIGGMVLKTHDAATEAAFKENYPGGKRDGQMTLEPSVLGEFSKLLVDGLRVYIPRRMSMAGHSRRRRVA